jgi:hypothetical protein
MPRLSPTLPLPETTPVDEILDDLREVEAREAYAADVWTWLSACVTTVDELDPVSPIKRFPTSVCPICARYVGGAESTCSGCGGPTSPLTYLRDIARQWQSARPPLLLIPKARRMRLTWCLVACHTWLALHRPHANVFFVSSKEEKSGELIERARGILARLPAWGGGGSVVESRASPPLIKLDNGAMLMGVAEGADQLRQYTATAILADEFGTWAWPRAAYTAMRPCIDGGGRLTLLSSAWPGTWAEMVKGEFLG